MYLSVGHGSIDYVHGTQTQLAARLVRKPRAFVPPRDWPPAAREVITNSSGFVRILGGPGTGKTTLLATIVANRIARDGVNPEHILVLTASRRAADAIRAEISRQLTEEHPEVGAHTIREPLVRTVHSYAFGLLRLHANLLDLPSPRLLSGPEQDVVIRDLLAGDIEAGAPDWPPQLRPALAIPGFAEELRDLLLRAAERGLGPEDLIKVGERKQRPEWVSAGIFWQQYEEVTLLQGVGGNAVGTPVAPALDAAELVASALTSLDTDADLLAGERIRIRHLLVDDAQHLDPLQYRLLHRLGGSASDFVLAGDPDQSVFSFRGADPSLFTELDPTGERTITLNRSKRLSPAVYSVAKRIASRISGAVLRDTLVGTDVSTADSTELDPAGAVRTRMFPTPAAEASWVADQFRRAHLIDGVPWSQMAVLTRAPARTFPVLQRALRAAGVPVSSITGEIPLAKQSGVRPLLAALKAIAAPSTLDADLAETLLSSPLGGADPLALRRMRRGLRRLELASGGERASDELLLESLWDNDKLAGLADAEARPIRRVAALLAAGQQEIARGGGLAEVLWRLWDDSGIRATLLKQAERGGSLGAQADSDLDAVVALFHVADQYVDRLPHASIAGFVDYLSAQHIASNSLAPVAQRGEGVSLLSAHSAAGREWTVVAIISVQEGSWPDLRLRGSLLGVERLVDVLDGIEVDTVSLTTPLLAEERRLFYLAATRARHTLLVSAVVGEDEQPSRFLEDLREDDGTTDAPAVRNEPSARGLVLAELVGDLRSAVCDDNVEPSRRQLAAQQLARLAAAGVPGAHPDSWYGLAGESTQNPLHPDGEVVTVSPSTVDVLARCPLRWLIERHGGSDPAQLAAITGTLVHELAQAAASGLSDDQLRQALDDAWARVDAGAPWFSRRERRRVEKMLDSFGTWLTQSRAELTQVGVEKDIEVEVPAEPGGVQVRLRGRVDRLEVDSAGRPVIVDVKTSKNPVSAEEARLHPQLAAYQLAVLLGAIREGKQPGGARLVYVAKPHNQTGAVQRGQEPLDAEAGKKWLSLVREVAAATVGPRYQVKENPDCDRCPARSSCPIRPEGRQVTQS